MAVREFVIPVRRRWTLWILPILAILYFVLVIFLVAKNTKLTKGISNEMLMFGGLAFFALVILIEIPFFLRRKVRVAPAPAAAPHEWQDEEPEPVERGVVDDERLITAENQQGLRVLEYSRPAKSQNKGAVYAKTYVPVTKEFVMRIETLAADRADL